MGHWGWLGIGVGALLGLPGVVRPEKVGSGIVGRSCRTPRDLGAGKGLGMEAHRVPDLPQSHGP